MNKILFTLLGACLAIISCSDAGNKTVGKPNSTPNIIYILADSQC